MKRLFILCVLSFSVFSGCKVVRSDDKFFAGNQAFPQTMSGFDSKGEEGWCQKPPEKEICETFPPEHLKKFIQSCEKIGAVVWRCSCEMVLCSKQVPASQ